MDELLNKVAEIRGMPASLIKRSAEARAEKEGTTVEAVLMEWAGEAGSTPATAEVSEAPEAESASPAVAEVKASEPEPAPKAVPGEITVDYLIQLAADAKRMPPKLILSSAEARAEHSGASLEKVLAGWAGVSLEELKASPKAAAPASAPEAEPAATPESTVEPASAESDTPAPTSPPAADGGSGTVIGMDELLEKVAAAKGMPAALAKRSAEARAKKTGESLEAVLAEWAGIDPASVTTEAAPSAPPPAQAPQAAQAAPSSETAEHEESADAVEVIEGSADDESDSEPAAKLPAGRYPAWLAAAFVIIPLIAVMFIIASPNGPDCGTSGQLLVDPVSGEAVNCDGSAYGTTVIDHFANGAAIYAQCQACHGTDGGGGAGPPFIGGSLLTTFPEGQCSVHREWVTLGTAGWPDPTYGAPNKPVGGFGLMPSFGVLLSDQQIAEVALYERVQFGGQDLAAAETDCDVAAVSVEASGP